MIIKSAELVQPGPSEDEETGYIASEKECEGLTMALCGGAASVEPLTTPYRNGYTHRLEHHEDGSVWHIVLN